jgi:hypothetical protein
MDAVQRQDDHDDEVGDQQRDVEGVPAVLAAEGAVEQMGSEIVPEGVLGGNELRQRVEVDRQRGLSSKVFTYSLRESL